MEAAGYKEKIAEKYKNQGLRVVSISGDSYNDKQLIDKWMTAKADYPLYTNDKNILYEFYPGGGVPYDACVKRGEKIDENKGGLRGKGRYDKYIKKAFKFK